MAEFETMVECVGKAVLYFGGVGLMLFLIGLLTQAVGEMWIMASNKWRDICKAESLIHEYRRNRKDYMKWKELQANTEKDGD